MKGRERSMRLLDRFRHDPLAILLNGDESPI